MTEPIWLDLDEVCVIQAEILAESGGAPGVLNQGALESTLNKPRNLYHYCDKEGLKIGRLCWVSSLNPTYANTPF